jgi:transcriptional regulator with XRE-family HTH domain
MTRQAARSGVKPLVLFRNLSMVLRHLRGRRNLREVAEAAGVAPQHLSLLEYRPARQYGSRNLPERAGKAIRLDTLDLLLRYYGISLSELDGLLRAADEGRLETKFKNRRRRKESGQ